jgi:hypothetical protein
MFKKQKLHFERPSSSSDRSITDTANENTENHQNHASAYLGISKEQPNTRQRRDTAKTV